MRIKGNRLPNVSGKSAMRRSIQIACGAAMLTFMAPGAHGGPTYTWTSSSSGNFSTGTNWQGGSAPAVDPLGDVSLEFSAPGAYTANNDLGAFGVFNTTFDAASGPVTISGGDFNLYNPAAEPTFPSFTNNSTNPVTINSNVTFESTAAQGAGTPENFYLAPGSTTTFNGTMTLTGDSGLKMYNNQSSGTGGPGGTMIWTQPVTFSNVNSNGNYFPFRIYEGTFEMGGYTITNGSSDAPIQNLDGFNVPQTTGVNTGVQTDVYLGPEDFQRNFPNDVASFYLMAPGQMQNYGIQLGSAGTMTVGGLNTSGTVYYNDYFRSLPDDGNGALNGVPQTFYFSAAAGGTVVQEFPLIGGGTGGCFANFDKVGPGTWVVAAGGNNPTAVQAYFGNTIVRDGTLELAYDDTATNFVTVPAAVIANPASNYYASGTNGGSLGFNAATNAVQLGDSGTLATDNIALLTLMSSSSSTRMVLHNISVNNDNPSGTTSIGAADSGTGNFMGNILLNRSVVLTSGTGGTANFSGNITGVGGVSVGGTGTVDISGANTYGGGTTVNTGTLVVGNYTAILTASPLTVAAGATAVIANGAEASLSTPVNLSSLTLTGNGTLDIMSNLVLITDSPAQATSVLAALKTGHASGWAGPGGIVSTTAATHAGYGVAFGQHSFISSIPSGEIQISYTLYGDINQDGVVNGTDFGILAGNFGHSVTGGWEQGDLNYDGTVNGTDFGLLAGNFGKSATGRAVILPASQWAALDSFAAQHGLLADVPEPGSLALAGIASISLLNRRRRTMAN
jgi:autotransporter-associated beta strand protein